MNRIEEDEELLPNVIFMSVGNTLKTLPRIENIEGHFEVGFRLERSSSQLKIALENLPSIFVTYRLRLMGRWAWQSTEKGFQSFHSMRQALRFSIECTTRIDRLQSERRAE